MKQFIPLLFFITIIQSACVITNTPGFYSGYKKLLPEQLSMVKFLDNEAIISRDNTKIFAVTSNSLLKRIEEEDTVLIYIWSAHCTSDVCIPIAMVQNYCNKKNFELFVVSEYYDQLMFKNVGATRNPLLAINHKYYKTDYCPKYTKLFLRALDEDKLLNESNRNNRFWFFGKGKLINTKSHLN